MPNKTRHTPNNKYHKEIFEHKHTNPVTPSRRYQKPKNFFENNESPEFFRKKAVTPYRNESSRIKFDDGGQAAYDL